MIKKDEVIQKLNLIIYPGFTKSIVDFNFIKNINITNETIGITLEIPSASNMVKSQIEEEILKRLSYVGKYKINTIIIQPTMLPETSSHGKNVLPNIQNFIMVSSGKGGVGKSTTTINLAIAFAKKGKRVGVLDADIYGPNIPRMMGIENQEPIFLGKTIKPIQAHNIKVMSIGSLIQKGASLLWKGAMVTQAIEQMLEDVQWGDLDVLLFDMPPGTGDAQLTLAQNLPITAGVCVTTPQKVALDDTVRSMDMMKQLNIPIAGIVENMSGFICPENGKEYAIFGKGTTQPLADAYETEILGEIPIELSIREGGDNGLPITIVAPNSEVSIRYQLIAESLWKKLININESGGVSNEEIQPTIF